MNFDVIIRSTYALLFLFMACCWRQCAEGLVVAHFDSKHFNKEHKAIKHIMYCKNCPSAKDEGSILSALIAKHSPQKYDVTGALVYCLPNYAEGPPLNNYDLRDNIAFVDRGKISIIEKVTILQRTGAIAVIIADNGECDNDFKSCGSRIGSADEGGLGAYDFADVWSDINIPVVIVTKQMSNKLRKLMEVKRRKFPRLGYQLVNILDPEDEEDEEDEEEDDDFEEHDEL